MTERFIHDNRITLDTLGLTPEDVNTRAILAVGYHTGELLPPYDSNEHRQRAISILRYLYSSPSYMTLSGMIDPDMQNLKRFLSGSKIIEVVGGKADLCVQEATIKITQQGRYAYVDSHRILGIPSTYSDTELGRMAR